MMHATQSDNPITKQSRERFLSRLSIIELRRATAPERFSTQAAFASCSARSTGWNLRGFRFRGSCPSRMTV